MINCNIRSGNKVVDDYIEALEKENQSFTTSNTKRLIRAIDGMAGKIADDLELINSDQQHPDGKEVELSSKFIDNFIKMTEKADKIEAFSKIAESMYGVSSNPKPSTEPTVETSESDDKGTFFERTQKKVKGK